MPATDAVIVSAARTPIGRARKGSLIGVDAFQLAEVAVGAAIERSGVPAADIDDIVVAESLQGGGVIARHVAVDLGLTGVPGLADNRHCAAGLSAIQIAASSIMAGMDSVAVAGGTESLSTSPSAMKRLSLGADPVPWMSPSHRETPDAPAFDMTITVGDNCAKEAGLTRRDLDEWAAYTHGRAIESIDNGWFESQIVPVEAPQPDGSTLTFAVDEHPRRGTTVEGLAELKPLHPEIDGFTITAGNSAGLNDAAAAVMLTSSDYATSHGLEPLARIVAWASVGIEPARTGMAPTLAIPKALERAGMAIGDIELWEINEAFCSVPVAAVRALGIDPTIVNTNGSGCSLGHPIAATGARMVVTMVHELRRRGLTRGLVSMCAGGGMGSALVLEIP
ncbi:thiolase family protein [Rhabdothermincola salaria]|uniref:thiolase family protein n=1 Tax=Rhabdothermincola salaria TaxID=2903142 RepID=UPI001E65A44F|nr:thiolase family protein [Rhabdothermincola salaria]